MHNEDMQQPATKADLEATATRLRADLQESEIRLRSASKADLQEWEARLRSDMATKSDLKASETRLRNDMGVWAARLEGRSTAHFDAMMDQFAQFRSYLMEVADRLTKKTLDGDMERVLLSERVNRLEGRVEKLEGEA